MSQSPVDKGQECPDNKLSLEDWQKRWEERQIGFHKDHINPILKDHVEYLINSRENITVFFPLCGKTLDMKWFYDMGHSVVGVETSQSAIEEFFTENNLEYKKEDCSEVQGKLMKTNDERVKIYNCDLFAYSSSVSGLFDGIWDRGSLVAINKAMRQKYADHLVSLMAPDCRYLLCTVSYDPKKYGGPPHTVPPEQIPQLYGSKCDIQNLMTQEETSPKWKERGIDMVDRLDLLTLKKH